MTSIESGIKTLRTKEETAVKLRISLPTLNRLLANGKIRSIKIGQTVRFEDQAIENYLNNFTTVQKNQ